MENIPVFNDVSAVTMIFRIVFAGLCGIMAGYGRQRSNKPSGIKTHMVVAFASAIFMLISKYGFTDSESFDASRAAAGAGDKYSAPA